MTIDVVRREVEAALRALSGPHPHTYCREHLQAALAALDAGCPDGCRDGWHEGEVGGWDLCPNPAHGIGPHPTLGTEWTVHPIRWWTDAPPSTCGALLRPEVAERLAAEYGPCDREPGHPGVHRHPCVGSRGRTRSGRRRIRLRIGGSGRGPWLATRPGPDHLPAGRRVMPQPSRTERAGYRLRRDIEAVFPDATTQQVTAVLLVARTYADVVARDALLAGIAAAATRIDTTTEAP